VSIQKHAEHAAIERLWSHTVGIANRALAEVGKDPDTGLQATEIEKPGTGVAGLWGTHYFIETAKHVLDAAKPSDLRFFVRQTGELKIKRASEVTVEDGNAAAPLNDQDAVIHRCEWEDIAIVAIRPDALGNDLEFFDIANSWTDPTEGAIVSGVGYPLSHGVRFGRRIGSHLHQSVLLSPTAFNGAVLPSPSSDDIKFKFVEFDSGRHYLIPYEHSKDGKRPEGISGAAVWMESDEKHPVWTPRFKFAGTCTCCYKKGTIEQVVKASAVCQFLTEVYGHPER
jgi:hypothetical protein